MKPKLVCEVQFTEWTQNNYLRHPSFKGLRFDKNTIEVTKNKPIHWQILPPPLPKEKNLLLAIHKRSCIQKIKSQNSIY
ncbi:hypothetical protein [Legionella sp.]|uniref:ATP dependent DNA ligase n=1 Tax=Legionella sp. TaxID=459 RepID=UPI003D120D9E